MTLSDWLARNKMSDAEFARVSGIGQRALVGKYRHGRLFPAANNLLRIRNATNGEVTADDFVDQHTGVSSEFPAPDLPGAPKPRVKRSSRALAAPLKPANQEALQATPANPPQHAADAPPQEKAA